MNSLSVILFFTLLFAGVLQAAPLAFPGAEGFGRFTVGGRGGKVIEVTNLNDNATGPALPGSLREAVNASGPRIVVFRVGGTITLQRALVIQNPYITIAGQTAPGGGICLRNNTTNINGLLEVYYTHDVILRYLRVRVGAPSSTASNLDGIKITGNGRASNTVISPTDTFNIIIDHCSVGWGIDENVAVSGAWDTTVQWSIVSEGLYNSVHVQGSHGLGLFIAYTSKRVTAHHNLMAHHDFRNPAASGDLDDIEIINNVTYNWKQLAQNNFIDTPNGHTDISIVGNYFKPGANSWVVNHEILMGEATLGATWSAYVRGNIGHYRTSDSQPDSDSLQPSSVKWLVNTPPFTPTGVVTTSAAQAYIDVLAKAGATLPMRDTVDQRIVNEVKNKTGIIIDSPSQVGGWPVLAAGTPPVDSDHDGMADSWEMANFGNLARGSAANSSGDLDGNGYTDLEEYLNSLAGEPAPALMLGPVNFRMLTLGATP